MIRPLRVLLASLLLSACGTESQSPILNLARATLDANRQDTVKPDIAAQQTAIRQAVLASGTSDPVLMVALPKRNAVATLVLAARNGQAVTWLDSTGVSVVTRRGIVIATRGLGSDVMSSDVSGTLQALDRGGTGYVRTQRFLDGEGHLQERALTCDAARAGPRVTETCQGGGATVTNRFELRGSAVVQSWQWLGAGVGFAEITRLQ